MLNEKQLIIADAVLTFLREKDNSVSKYELYKYLFSGEFNEKEINTTISFLDGHYKLIELFIRTMLGQELENYRITPEGNKAIKVGIVKYLAQKERENKKSKTPIIISIIALVIAAIQPGISLYKLIFSENKTENSYYKDSNGKNHTDSIVEQVLTDTTFTDKLKDSFIHDTVFLNELKNQNQRKNN